MVFVLLVECSYGKLEGFTSVCFIWNQASHKSEWLNSPCCKPALAPFIIVTLAQAEEGLQPGKRHPSIAFADGASPAEYVCYTSWNHYLHSTVPVLRVYLIWLSWCCWRLYVNEKSFFQRHSEINTALFTIAVITFSQNTALSIAFHYYSDIDHN